MGFQSQDDLINQITTNGKADTAFMNKALGAAGIAGAWTLLGPNAGSPPLSVYTGSDLVYVPTDDTWAEGVTWTGGNKSPATKHFLSAGASVVAAAGAPWYILAVDMVGFVPLTTTNVSTTGTKTVTMTAIAATGSTGDRYPNGEGLRMFVAADTAMGANAPTCIVNYLDTGGNAGATTTFTSTASVTIGNLLNTGAAANKYNPFLPLAAGDTGVSDIVSLVWASRSGQSRFQQPVCTPRSISSMRCRPCGRFPTVQTYSSCCSRLPLRPLAALYWLTSTTHGVARNGKMPTRPDRRLLPVEG
jgi:hypothetical protein